MGAAPEFSPIAAARAAFVPSPGWLGEARAGALAALEARGFPSVRDEAWRFSNPKKLLASAFPLANGAEPDLSDRWWAAAGIDRAVFVDGRFSARWSAGEGFGRIADAGDAPRAVYNRAVPAEGGFEALNGAFATDGAWIDVAGERAAPLHVVHVSTGAERGMAHVRHGIRLRPHARAVVVEVWEGAGSYLATGATEVDCGDGASLEHIRIQAESLAGFHLGAVGYLVGRDANVVSRVVSFGAAFARTAIHAWLGTGATIQLDGLVLARGEQHVDHHTRVEHTAPNGTSRERYKQILDGSARGVFTGRVVVAPHATRTDASQANPNLVLSDRAIAHTRPQLEIRCDDVKASHGATVGRLDEEALFYLRARGIGLADARAMLTSAFAEELLAELPAEAARDAARAATARWLHTEGA